MAASKSWLELLVEFHGDLLDKDRVKSAEEICTNGGVRLTTITPFQIVAKVGAYTVELGHKPGEDNVFTASCVCADRKHRGTICKHMIATGIVADNRQPVTSFLSVGADTAGLLSRLSKAYPDTSGNAITWEALKLLDSVVNDERAAGPLQKIIDRGTFESMEDILIAALNYALNAPDEILELSLPMHKLD